MKKFNLQLFADAGTLVTGTDGYKNAYDGTTTAFDTTNSMTAAVKSFYDTELLENARIDMIYAQLGKKQPLPAGGGKTVEWRKFNTFAETISSRLEACAGSIANEIEYRAVLDGRVDDAKTSLDAYIAETSGYIKQGIVGYDGITPVIGVAIGQDIKTTGAADTAANGRVYDVIDTSNNMSVWTAQKLSFYISGAEVAYFSNNSLHVGGIEVENSVVLGGKWEITYTPGFTVKWIGGD